MIALLFFPFYYVYEIAAGALRIARDIVTPHPKLNPVFLRVPLDITSPRQRLLLANLISMTPGTVSVDETRDDILLVHSLYGGADPEGEIRQIKSRFESFVAKLPL